MSNARKELWTFCCGIEPGKLKFKQNAMRNHLYRCFNKVELRMFPATSLDVQATVRSTDFFELFCSYRMPEMSPVVGGITLIA